MNRHKSTEGTKHPNTIDEVPMEETTLLKQMTGHFVGPSEEKETPGDVSFADKKKVKENKPDNKINSNEKGSIDSRSRTRIQYDGPLRNFKVPKPKIEFIGTVLEDVKEGQGIT